ncbi:MAG TPA: response regulator transcription factor [Polyangia bacterium]
MGDARLILIVDDEPDLRALLDFNLRQAGFRTAEAASGAEALARARALKPALVLLDLNLPDLAGTEVCRLLKAEPHTRAIPILMLTARGSEADRILGLELGADDYVAKPFSVREVMLRVEAICRRSLSESERASKTHRRLTAGPIELDLETYLARVDGTVVPLTLLEFRLLAYLIEGRGRVRTRDALLAEVWNASPEIETRTIDTHVKRLRDKLGAAGERIETVRGIGYRLGSPDE